MTGQHAPTRVTVRSIPPHCDLRTLRVRIGLTQADLARATGTTEAHISQIETGAKGVSEPLLRSLETALGVPSGALATAYRPRQHKKLTHTGLSHPQTPPCVGR